MSVLRQKSAPIQSRAAQVAIGFEALGFQLALDQGIPKAKAESEPHRARLARIAGEIDSDLPFERSEWISDSTAVYNGLKHANRAYPDNSKTFNTHRKDLLVFRAWVATRCGAPRAVLESQLKYDNLAQKVEFVNRF
jgi:hypothetical protein